MTQLWFNNFGEIEEAPLDYILKPRKLRTRKINVEKAKKIYKLSEQEQDEYNFYVDKSELLNFFNEDVFDFSCKKRYSEKGNLARLFASVEQYVKKDKKELTGVDFLSMYMSIKESFSSEEELNGYRISDWRKINSRVKFFGVSQFKILEHYLESIKRE